MITDTVLMFFHCSFYFFSEASAVADAMDHSTEFKKRIRIEKIPF